MFKIKINKRDCDGIILTRDYITATTIHVDHENRKLHYTKENNTDECIIDFSECSEIYIDDVLTMKG